MLLSPNDIITMNFCIVCILIFVDVSTSEFEAQLHVHFFKRFCWNIHRPVFFFFFFVRTILMFYWILKIQKLCAKIQILFLPRKHHVLFHKHQQPNQVQSHLNRDHLSLHELKPEVLAETGLTVSLAACCFMQEFFASSILHIDWVHFFFICIKFACRSFLAISVYN